MVTISYIYDHNIIISKNMFKSKFFILFFIPFVIASCSMEQKAEVDIINLSAYSVKMDSAYMGQYPYFIHNNYLFSFPTAKDKGCCISRISKDSISNSDYFLNIGNGHDEFLHIFLGKGGNGSLLVLNSPQTLNKLLSLTSIPAGESVEQMKKVELWKKYSLSNIQSSFSCTTRNVVGITDSTLLIVGHPYEDPDHIFYVLDYKNQKLTKLDYFPSDGIKCNNFIKCGMYTNGSSIYSNGKDRFLYLCNEGYFAFIFTIEGNHVKVVKEIYSEYPKYKDFGDNMNYRMEKRLPKRLKCDVNNDNIYFLHVNKDKERNKSEDYFSANFGDAVDVYNWDGIHEKTILLEEAGNIITVSEDNEQLYLFNYLSNPEKNIVTSYSLYENK